MSDDARHSPDQPDQSERTRPELEGPGSEALEAEEASAAAARDTFEQAEGAGLESGSHNIAEPAGDPEIDEATPRAGRKLERLQKILARAGIASRRHAEELISEGRVQVNGKVVTELGSKADPAQDHIRVDGKLLQGSERHRYFMLNKPKGFVTTVSDPEGRPTIMQFFAKMRERLYPVGRLDYMSEGLLLVTNDGELANKLTRAALGVEKIYLVKVSGQPSEEDLERLRQGISIDRGKPGSGRVNTAPAQIRRFRPGKAGSDRQGGRQRTGDNPWFEVILVEGRNRELRKMFEEIGHHVEKIRRIGYGPLVLDLEPGKLRELEPEEVEDLRKAADGKFRRPKPREPRRRDTSISPESPQRDSSTKRERGSERPYWKEHQGQGRGDRGDFRRESSQGFRLDRQRTTRGSGGRIHVEKSFESARQDRPWRRDREKNAFGGSGERRGPSGGEQGRADRAGSRGFGSRPPRAERPPRQDFGKSREAGGEQSERRRFNPDVRRRTGKPDAFGRDRGREQRPHVDRPYGGKSAGSRGEERGGRRGDRPARAEHRSSDARAGGNKGGPKSAGYKRGKPGGFGAKSGNVRSAGGRRPGSRPGGKPGNKPGGKRRP